LSEKEEKAKCGPGDLKKALTSVFFDTNSEAAFIADRIFDCIEVFRDGFFGDYNKR